MKSREDYDRAIVLTRKLVHAWDPMRTLASGAPQDEFDDEVARLVARIPRITDAADAGIHVADVFTAQFGRGVIGADAAAQMGERWYDALREADLLAGATKP